VKAAVLFRAAAGPRMGFGHLVRCRTLAAALGTEAIVSLRGSRSSAKTATSLGLRLAGPLAAAIRRLRPALLVVDDPSSRAAARAVRAARRWGIATASVHDLGLAPSHADVTIDGSIAPGPMSLAGPRFAVLDPSLQRLGAFRRLRATEPTVVVSFGGGPRRRLALAVARAIARRRPDVTVRVAWGFGEPPRLASHERLSAIEPSRFHRALATAAVAVLAGGVTLYEACALGVPAVGVSIVRAQRKSVSGLGACGAVIDAGHAGHAARTADRIAGLVGSLIDDPARRRKLSRTARGLVDGRGADRVARSLRSLIAESAERLAA
jgi:spore coat polysaccharide biosynthesis predicted glycosyltransferase SpsG